MLRRLAVVVFVLMTALQGAASEPVLRQYFEGKTVTVKVDMPANKVGIDVFPESVPGINYPEYAARLKRHGIALRRGESVIVTKIKVKEKNIEFQLGGGGYGTALDDSGDSVFVSSPGKTQREKNLEGELKKEADQKRRRELQEQLDELRKERQREQARLEAAVASAEAIKRENVRQRALHGGSRFNLVFPNGVPERALAPQFIEVALREWVEFADRSAAAPEPGTPPQLRKGMTENELQAAFGTPVGREQRRSGELQVEVLTFRHGQQTLVATLVEGVMVRYTLSSN